MLRKQPLLVLIQSYYSLIVSIQADYTSEFTMKTYRYSFDIRSNKLQLRSIYIYQNVNKNIYLQLSNTI